MEDTGMYIVANWKMNGSHEAAREWMHSVSGHLRKEPFDGHCIVCPPATLLHEMGVWGEGTPGLTTGGQDCHTDFAGAFTGDVAAKMLKEVGASYVILGHSERRRYHGETDNIVAAKVKAALAAGVTPIVCVGETQEQYERNETLSVTESQALAAIADGQEGEVLVAYEPVWAIGSGKIPGLGEIEVAHSAIAAFLTEKKGIAPERISVLYGGSVNAGNAKEILRIPDVGGVLVGTASLDAAEFCHILDAGR